MKEQINLAIKEDRLKPNEGMRLLAEHERGLTDRTIYRFRQNDPGGEQAAARRCRRTAGDSRQRLR